MSLPAIEQLSDFLTENLKDVHNWTTNNKVNSGTIFSHYRSEIAGNAINTSNDDCAHANSRDALSVKQLVNDICWRALVWFHHDNDWLQLVQFFLPLLPTQNTLTFHGKNLVPNVTYNTMCLNETDSLPVIFTLFTKIWWFNRSKFKLL